MALTGINVFETRQYVSKKDPDKQNPTVFEIGVLTSDIRSYIENKVQSYEFARDGGNKGPATARLNLTLRNMLVCKFGIKKITNLIDPQTQKPVEFDTTSIPISGKNYNGVSDALLEMLGPDLRLELATEIMGENNLSEDEIKN